VNDGVEIRDLKEIRRGGEWWYTFKWRGPRWEEALFILKDAIAREDREYNEETHVWSVRITVQTALELSILFPNFWPAIMTWRSQLSLFEVSDD